MVLRCVLLVNRTVVVLHLPFLFPLTHSHEALPSVKKIFYQISMGRPHQKQTSQQDKDAVHWLDISEGTRCGVESRSMYRTQVVWLEADALYAFEGLAEALC